MDTQSLKQQLEGLKGIISVAQVVVSSLELDEVLKNILFSAQALIDVPAGSVALYDDKRAELAIHAHTGFSERFVARDRWKVTSGGLTQTILDRGELFIIEDTRDAPYFNNPLALEEGIRSLIAVPLTFQERTVGVLYLDDFVPRQFPQERLDLLSILASFAAMSIDNARLHDKMRRLACTDGLTGLYNHRQFKELLAREVNRAQRFQVPLSLVMFDVDNFKAFNDTYGHPVGDQVLIRVGQLLRSTLREVDLVCRYGGEEFVTLLPETSLENALPVAERIRREISARATTELEPAVNEQITVSIGVAAFPGDGRSPDELLQVVDALMYRAKREGKNAVYSNLNPAD